MGAIEVERITKHFGNLVAVGDVSFSVAEGEMFGLLGPNGAGKTTLIRMLTTLVVPTSGTARVHGHDILKEPDGVRQCIGVIPQAITSDPELTAEENLLIHAKLYGVPAAQHKKLFSGLFERVDLAPFRHELVRNYSGGMRRRLEIARGLVHHPQILFLDEPTTGLDPASRLAVWEMILNLKEEQSLTILLTTHYMDEADRLCARVAIVDHGKLVVLDTPARLKASVPGTNILEAQFEGTPADWLEKLGRLEEVASVTARDGTFRISSHHGSKTVAALMDCARQHGVSVKSLSVQSTTLDDVFMHYTGRALRDEVKEGFGYDISHLYR